MHHRVCCHRRSPTAIYLLRGSRAASERHLFLPARRQTSTFVSPSEIFMHSGLVVLSQHNKCAEIQALLQQAQASNCSRVYVTTCDADAVITQQLLDWLCELYNAAAAVHPRFDAVPCLACAGWSADKLATLSDVRTLLSPPALLPQAQQLQQQFNANREADQAAQLQIVDAATAAAAAAPPHADLAQQQQKDQQSKEQHQLLFEAVAVGGTFDRLHAGHRLLLAATALVCSKHVYIGITSDALLAKKANKHLLHQYEARCAAAVDFMMLVRPGLAVQAGALTDPQEPTQAELDPGMQALVVSQETLAGGEAINRGRQQRGFASLHLVVVGLIGGDAASKLSSTALREADAAAAGGLS